MLKFRQFSNPLNGKGGIVYVFGALLLFFALYDGIISYLLPLVVTEHAISKTMLGMIFATAAVSGAFFDFAIYRIFKNAFYRRLFFAMFAAAAAYIFIIWSAELILLYFAAMAIWGFYYDLKSFGTLDFVSRYSEKKEISGNFGIIQSFQAVGYLLAPLIAGFLIIDIVDWQPFAAAVVFLVISALFFALLLVKAHGMKQHIPQHEKPRRGFAGELAGWKRAGSAMLPILFLGAFATVIDSFFMAIGPLLAESMPIEPFDGIFMFAYYLPPLFMGGLVGLVASRFGEKNTALFGLLIGAALLSLISFFSSPLAVVFIVFASACFTSMLLPIVQGTYARLIRKSPSQKKEIQELGDFASNFGYIIGPVAAGMIADALGNAAAFSVLGIAGIGAAAVLFATMPGTKK